MTAVWVLAAVAAVGAVLWLVWWFLLPAPQEHDDTRRADDAREPTGFSHGDVTMFWDH